MRSPCIPDTCGLAAGETSSSTSFPGPCAPRVLCCARRPFFAAAPLALADVDPGGRSSSTLGLASGLVSSARVAPAAGGLPRAAGPAEEGQTQREHSTRNSPLILRSHSIIPTYKIGLETNVRQRPCKREGDCAGRKGRQSAPNAATLHLYLPGARGFAAGGDSRTPSSSTPSPSRVPCALRSPCRAWRCLPRAVGPTEGEAKIGHHKNKPHARDQVVHREVALEDH
jgi:hypothetical protein